MNKVYIGLGSNLGDKVLNIKKAILELEKSFKLKKTSGFYKTSPVGYEAQSDFVNVVCCITTELEPNELLDKLKGIEKKFLRDKGTCKWGPRTIDLDILLYSQGLVVDTDDLQVPHIYMHERKFVLEPLAEIAPKLEHPILNLTIEQLLDSLDTDEKVEKLEIL
jgi:2-amino-4-hydroxy-6-hydroxymethyldihydropteridine diphosphokinase